MEWKPIINDKYRVQKKLENIYTILKNRTSNSNLGLMGGNLGISIFFFYYKRYLNTKSKTYEEIETLEEIFEVINNGYSFSKFANGLSGFVWSLMHLLDNNFISKETDFGLDILRPYLAQEMFADVNKGYYDYLHGALGLALSLSKYKQLYNCNSYLSDFLDVLFKKGIYDGKSIKWKSKLTLEQDIFGYNLSLSHGMSSIIGVLLLFIKNGILKEKSIRIIKPAIKYIIKHASSNDNTLSVFPNMIIDNEKNEYISRLAWCYGDLGIGITLWRAGNVLKWDEIKDFGEKIVLRSIIRKNLKENYVVDGGLCHGTVGIAHIYNRMFHYTGKKEFKESALFWIEETLKMAKYENGLAGYMAWRTPKYGGLQNEYGLLEGIAGIGLVLISVISDIEPKWDECLLLS